MDGSLVIKPPHLMTFDCDNPVAFINIYNNTQKRVSFKIETIASTKGIITALPAFGVIEVGQRISVKVFTKQHEGSAHEQVLMMQHTRIPKLKGSSSASRSAPSDMRQPQLSDDSNTKLREAKCLIPRPDHVILSDSESLEENQNNAFLEDSKHYTATPSGQKSAEFHSILSPEEMSSSFNLLTSDETIITASFPLKRNDEPNHEKKENTDEVKEDVQGCKEEKSYVVSRIGEMSEPNPTTTKDSKLSGRQKPERFVRASSGFPLAKVEKEQREPPDYVELICNIWRQAIYIAIWCLVAGFLLGKMGI